ncbi:MAG: HAMP domain-containing protein [Desulfobacterales bacterium]|nr:HAMP domain-containing protein [Desulfobacterales bacterium]
MKEKIGIKVALLANLVIFIIMLVGTIVLFLEQSSSLEAQLLDKGKMQSVIGAKIVSRLMEEAIDNRVFSEDDAFDQDYQKMPGDFDPPKFNTKYDSYLDRTLLPLEDEFLLDDSVVFAVAVDVNGYLPTHNTRYTKEITGDKEKDLVGNRTKRVFNDSVGIKAAKNTQQGFLQVYHRDTGETMWDVSSPIYVKGKHWGGFRIGSSLKVINAAKNRLMYMVIAIMSSILLISIVIVFIVVNSTLQPLEKLTAIAEEIAAGKIEDKIEYNSSDEVGKLASALEKLRMSMVIAMKRLKK